MRQNSNSLIFATGNANKLQEVRQMLPNKYTVKGLVDIGCSTDIPETAHTLKGNALLKAQYVVGHFGMDCFSEDTGLEIDFLDGAPGVLSARFAGKDKDAVANMQKALQLMEHTNKRKARFRTVIALIMGGQVHYFEGIVNGQITRRPVGTKGFGYDPIFQPEGFDQTFAELDSQAKNSISHRGRAFEELLSWLQNFER